MKLQIAPKNTDNTKKSRHRIHWSQVLLSAIILILIAVSIFFYFENRRAKFELEELKSPEHYAKEQLEQNQLTITSLRKHLLLPEDEDPSLYTITDIAHAQAAYGDFFKDAQDGDKLIVYKNKAIIYRLTDELIVNIGPIAYIPAEDSTPQE